MIVSTPGGRIAGLVPQALELVKGSLARKQSIVSAYSICSKLIGRVRPWGCTLQGKGAFRLAAKFVPR